VKREIFIGDVGIGGSHPVSIQSMTSTSTEDIHGTLSQIRALHQAGCDIVRVAIPKRSSMKAFRKILAESPLPVIADIHFDARIALMAIEAGAPGIRINPGNIGDKKNLIEILKAANQASTVIRIGVNAGSLEKSVKSGRQSRAERMVESALNWIGFFEDQGFFRTKVSLKSSDVRETIQAYRIIDRRCDYPLHLGITEAGPFTNGTVKSAIGIGVLLLEGIGNTIRVSLTDEPTREVLVAKLILHTLGLRERGFEVISCPTCSRTTIDLISMVARVEEYLQAHPPSRPLKVAVMGCEVNGPGEAMDADIGLAFSQNHGYIFQNGEKIEKIAPEKALARLLELIEKL
jgi:(E)-4-hydroxy-3-methylbut-2-enyl-diphosphate synthase